MINRIVHMDYLLKKNTLCIMVRDVADAALPQERQNVQNLSGDKPNW